MKLQIWKRYISEGILGAIHGQIYPIYEGFVPELKLTINHTTTFVSDDCSLYARHNADTRIVPTPQPEHICDIELDRSSIGDVIRLATLNEPERRIRQLIADSLRFNGLDASDYEDEQNQ